MIRDVTDDVTWVSVCYPHEDAHEHVSVYLVETAAGNVLVDSGSFHHEDEIMAGIEEATAGEGVDAIVLSHSDYPHSANIDEVRDTYDDVELVASSGAPELQGLSDARRCVIGENLDVLGRTFEFIDPPLADRSHTTWILDTESGVLFTADGFGNYHEPGECEYFSEDFEDSTPFEKVYEFHRDNLGWLRYVDAEKLRLAIDDIFESFEIRAVAPIHGNPVVEADVPAYLDRLERAAARIADEYEVPSAAD
jgi:flavorubredoxin